MALARIISRSQACSRALALDLLARGYAVEIVSPDNVPDNIADLELRVENGPGDQLTANVQAHDGGRTSSLDFVHHLKAPMGNFMRRSQQHGEADHSSGEPVRIKAAPGEKMELAPLASPPGPRAISQAPEIPVNRELDSGIDQKLDSGIDRKKESAPLITQQVAPPPPAEPPGYFAVAEVALPQPSMAKPNLAQTGMAQATTAPSRPAAKLRDQSAGWPGRAVLTFATVVLLAGVLVFSVRRTAGSMDAAQSFEAPPVEEIGIASAVVNPPTKVAEKGPAKDPGQVPALPLSPVPQSPAEAAVNSNRAPKEAPSASPQTAISHSDFIARDTVIYLDKRFAPDPKGTPSKSSLPEGTRNRTMHGGVVAANTILDKPAPKAAK